MNTDFESLLNEYNALEIMQSKTEFDANKIEFVHHSNRLEGSALTLIQTKDIVEHHKTKGETSIIDGVMAIDHYRALNLALNFGANKYPLSEKILLSLHESLLKNTFELDPFYQSWKDKGQKLGAYKVKSNRILYQINDTEKYYETPSVEDSKSLVIKSLALHQKSNEPFIAKLSKLIQNIYNAHPFFDGNKRMTRLIIANQLINDGLPLMPIPFNNGAYNKALIEGFVNQSNHQIQDVLKVIFSQYLAKAIESHKTNSNKPNKGFGLIL